MNPQCRTGCKTIRQDLPNAAFESRARRRTLTAPALSLRAGNDAFHCYHGPSGEIASDCRCPPPEFIKNEGKLGCVRVIHGNGDDTNYGSIDFRIDLIQSVPAIESRPGVNPPLFWRAIRLSSSRFSRCPLSFASQGEFTCGFASHSPTASNTVGKYRCT